MVIITGEVGIGVVVVVVVVVPKVEGELEPPELVVVIKR